MKNAPAAFFLFYFGQQPAENVSDVEELRASAAPRLRPADAYGIEPDNKPAAE